MLRWLNKSRETGGLTDRAQARLGDARRAWRSGPAVGLLGMLSLSLMLSGCASTPADEAELSPGTLGGRSGLELRRWAVRGTSGQAERVLGVLSTGGEADTAGEQQRWRDGGLRVARVSAEDVEVLRTYFGGGGTASLGGAVLLQERVEWVGMLPEWVPVHRGVRRPASAARIDSGLLNVDSGSVSLLARAWIMPGMSDGAMRLEMVPQVPVEGAEGTVFVDGAPLMRQRLGATLADGEALVVFPAGAWERADVGETGEVGEVVVGPARPESFRVGSGLDQIGPPVPTLPTLGELMLTVSTPDGEAVIEQVLLFIAHVPPAPSTFEVLERQASDGLMDTSASEAQDAVEGGEPVAQPVGEPVGEPDSQPESAPESLPEMGAGVGVMGAVQPSSDEPSTSGSDERP